MHFQRTANPTPTGSIVNICSPAFQAVSFSSAVLKLFQAVDYKKERFPLKEKSRLFNQCRLLFLGIRF